MSDYKEFNLYQKILMAADEIGNVEKNLEIRVTNNSSYKAVADVDVLKKVKAAEKKFGLVSIPVKQELVKSEIVRTMKQGGYEAISYMDVVKMTVRIINTDNPTETLEVESFGRGLDTGDKGFGKASTYARKYALLNAYKIATGEDPDETKSQEQIAAPTADEVRNTVINYLMNNVDQANQVCGWAGIQTIDDLPTEKVNILYKDWKRRGLI
jgi:hypothetical protein